MSWERLAAEAPELAEIAHACLSRFGVAMLATIRADGSPRLDPIEPVFVEGELLIGPGRRTAKARDLRRDPRYALHGMVSGPDAGDPDVKLYGRVERRNVLAGWWAERPADADVYALTIGEALTIEWDLASSRMLVRRWTAAAGETVVERPYP